MKILIIGAGRIGSSFGYLLYKKGFKITGIYNKHYSSACKASKLIGSGIPLKKKDLRNKIEEADLIVITTPDDKIAKIVELVSQYKHKSLTLIHMSGLYSSDILKHKNNDLAVFSLHPLQSVPDFEEGIQLLPEAVFTLEGCKKGKKIARIIINKLNLKYTTIEKKYKPLYHAAAVIASNYLVTLINSSYQLLEKAGLSETEFKKGLLNLTKGTLNNLEKKKPEDALTGPIARGDRKTIEIHLQALEEYKPQLLDLYKTMGKYTAKMIDKKEILKLFDCIKKEEKK